MILEIFLGVLLCVAIILGLIVLILTRDDSTIRCSECNKKLPHQGYDSVYCDDCKVRTYEERVTI